MAAATAAPLQNLASSSSSWRTTNPSVTELPASVSSFNGLHRHFRQPSSVHKQASLAADQTTTVKSSRHVSAQRIEFRFQQLRWLHVCRQLEMNIVFVSAEVAPWSKTGGLGDVLSGLPQALAALGHRVMTVAPRYDQYRDAWDTGVLVDVKAGNDVETVRFFHSYKKGVDRVFVDHPFFLEKVWGQTGSKIYGPEAGEDYLDNQIRYSMFNQAAIEAPLQLNLPTNPPGFSKNAPYGEDVIFVVNDWHSALVPLYLKANYKPKGIFENAKVAACIHNIAYQGRFAFQDFSLLNLADQFRASLGFMDGNNNKPVKGPKVNWMKAGLLESDLVLTVSPNYASELLSGADKGVELDDVIRKPASPDKGVELDDVIRKTGITGIVNGMDVEEWDPSTDKYLDVNYDATTVLEAKPSLKESLQAELGLPVNPNVPIIAFIGRLEEQKGFDILAQAVAKMLEDDVQLIALGTGKKSVEKQLLQLEMNFPRKARGIAKFNPAIAHMMVAGSDFVLVPSRFEPCGLIQLYAMRYGTIPVVASTGGLVDTVHDGETGIHVGRPFNLKCEEVDPDDVEALVLAVKRAFDIYRTPAFYKMVKTSMTQDFSWKEPAKKWEKVLASLSSERSASRSYEPIVVAGRA